MNVGAWLIWGFAATVLLTTALAASQSLRLTRINIPYLLGTMVTPHRDRAKWLGFFLHLLNGMVFSLVYIAAFEVRGMADWFFGGLIGLAHAALVLGVVLPSLPGIHPRMASETHGPTAGKQLEPPGFAAINYGYQTPVSIVIAHVIFGAVLGEFYGV